MAFSTKDVLDTMVADAGLRLSSLLVDGGAAANDWLMQFQADVLGVSVARPDLVETTALGAAGLAGLGAAVWNDASEFLKGRRFTRFSPRRFREAKALSREWRRAVAAALHWAKLAPRRIIES
jgi:glycerol kinase